MSLRAFTRIGLRGSLARTLAPSITASAYWQGRAPTKQASSVAAGLKAPNAAKTNYPFMLLTAGLGVAAITTGFNITHADGPDKKDESLSKEEIAAATAAIEDLLDNSEDDGLGPTLVRLAWHASGTYDKESHSGGSDGATMRFEPESNHGANGGLHIAREALEPVKKLFPQISYVTYIRIYPISPFFNFWYHFQVHYLTDCS